MLLLKRTKRKPQPVQISGQALCLHLELFRILPEAQLERKQESTQAAASLFPCPFVHMGCSWPGCRAGPLAGAQIPSAPQGASLAPRATTLGRGCEMLNPGASGLSSAFAEIPSKESLLPFPPKRATAGNPQKSARKGQRGRWGSKQSKIGLPGRPPWRPCWVCK